MKKIIGLITSVMLISLIGCSSISVSTDYDASIDFTKYKTYKWYEGEMPADDALVSHPLVQKRLVNSVDKALEAKGYTKGTSDNFDFVVIGTLLIYCLNYFPLSCHVNYTG